MTTTYFFCGVGGSGMSALALVLLGKGARVYGSDRGRDKGDSPEKFAALEQAGVTLFPQDGSGLAQGVDMLVVSSAVEETIPDVKAARALGIPVRKRAEMLAELVNASRGICVGGTSGKTTVTGMIAHILQSAGLSPAMMNGGQVVNFLEQGMSGNALTGGGDIFVTETDESDGSIALFEPAIAILNNITLDHKPLEELRPLFSAFLRKAREAAIVNLDDPEAAQLAGVHPQTLTFAVENPAARFRAKNIVPAPGGISFEAIDGSLSIPVSLKVPGRHNVANALGALACAVAAGLSLKDAARHLGSFKGIRRRFEVVGAVNGITVIDDFGHNPDKIAATLKTLREFDGRVIAVFQPHGFGPTRLLKDGLIATFTANLGSGDILLMPEIYYAGGTANKTISSKDIIDRVTVEGRQAHFLPTRSEIMDFLSQEARPGDRIVIMGARDDTLSDFARAVLGALKQRAA